MCIDMVVTENPCSASVSSNKPWILYILPFSMINVYAFLLLVIEALMTDQS
jgi:hypothetical protein